MAGAPPRQGVCANGRTGSRAGGWVEVRISPVAAASTMFSYCSCVSECAAPSALAFCIYMDTIMIEVLETDEFKAWLSGLRDRQALLAIGVRLARLARGLLGDHRPVGDGVSELRIHFGPGYRIYLVQRGDVLIVLLHGGDKSSQGRDIEKAKAIARSLEW